MFVLLFFVLVCHCTVADPIRLSCLELSRIRKGTLRYNSVWLDYR